jgi:hypothetical protein
MLWRRHDRGRRNDFYQESDPAVEDRLRRYYEAIGLAGARLNRAVTKAANNRKPWSAAFITYLFQVAGAGPFFPIATAHSQYVTTFKGALSRDTRTHPFQAWPLGALVPDVGDVICTWRDADEDTPGLQQPVIHGQPISYSAINPSSWRHFAGHCDVIVSISGNVVTAIGGNVGNSVQQTPYSTNAAQCIEHPRGVALIKNYY